MGRGRVSVYLSCFVLSAMGLAIVLAPALLTAHAQTLVSEALAFRAGPDFQPPPAPPLQSCLGQGQTFGDNDPARLDRVRCALPRSTDTPAATTSSPNTSSATQASPTGAPRPGTVGATQPTTSVVSQSSTGTPPSTTHANPPAIDLGFAYYAPGDLDPHDANHGRKGDRKVYLPNIIFPLRLAPDQHPHMNSQIWGHGGSGWDGKGEAGGSECDPVNYDPMLQRDTYCEIRSWTMPMCPGGTGHQGQDIRPPTCKDNTWEVVAVVDGIITQVTSNTTVRLKGADGTDYWYLHMHPQSITVKVGQSVKQGDVLGRVSKYMDGDPNGTTMHLHFQVRQTIRVDGKILSVYVPGYTSLIAAYRKAKGVDSGIGPDGNLIVDARFEIGSPKAAPTASSQPPPPVADQSAASGQPSAPTAGPAAQQSHVPEAPPSAAGQSAPGGQPSQPPASSAPQQPSAPAASSPAADQSVPSGQPPVVPQPPTPATPSPSANQSAPGGQPSPPTASSTVVQPPAPATPLPAADQSAPSGQQSAPTASSAASQPPSSAAPSPPTNPPALSSPPADQTAPSAQSPAAAASSAAPQPPAPTADQAVSSAHPSPTSTQPPTTASVPQPPQSWWQKALSNTKEWWNKLGK